MTQKSELRTGAATPAKRTSNSMEDPVSASAPARDDPRAILRGGLPDRYLTADDIAEIFEVPKETVYQWRKKRIGPPGFRIGKYIRYDPADVHAYVTSRKDADRNAA